MFEHFARAEARIEAILLKHNANLLLEPLSIADRVEAQDANAAAVWRAIAFYDLNRRCFAGSVRAEQGKHLACLNAEAQAIYGLNRAITLHQAFYDERQRGRRWRSFYIFSSPIDCQNFSLFHRLLLLADHC